MQNNDGFRFVMRRGPQPNQIFELSEAMITLGRDITNAIVINDREVSRHHLRLTRGADGYTLEDLGSTNGTFINGKRLTGAVLLKVGDMIGLGETVTLGYESNRPPVAGAGATMPSAQPNPYQPPQPAPQQPPAGASPYQPPQPAPQQPPAGASPYQPPQPAPADPYRPPTPSYSEPYQASQGEYAPQPEVSYAPPVQPAGYYGQPPTTYGAPPPVGAGYDYDPYAMREEGGNNTMRLVLFGCLGLLLFCCCVTVIGVVVIDQFNLYCQIPVVNQVLEALGLIRCAVVGG